MKSYFIKVIIFHILFYPLFTWWMCRGETPMHQHVLLGVFVFMFVASVIVTLAIPWIQYRKS
jgi:hypothetical protein